MTPTDTDLSRYYAARAREYERIYDKPERQADLARLKEMIPRYFAGADVLEIACGTGYWTQFIAPVARKVTALDVNPETLAIAACKPLPPERVRFDVADANALSSDYRHFTGAFAGFWWSHLLRADRRAFVDSLHGTLTRGATVVLLDNLYVPGSSTPISRTDADGNSWQTRRLADGSEHTVLKNFPSEAELVADIGSDVTAIEYTALEYFWLLKYELAA